MYREPFIDESTSKSVVGKTFITVGITIAAMAFTFLFIWSYNKSYKLFIMIFSIVVFAFALFTVVVVTLTRSKMTALQFRVYLSVTVFMTLMSLIMFIFFTILAVGHLRRMNAYEQIQTTVSSPSPSYSSSPSPYNMPPSSTPPGYDMYNPNMNRPSLI